MSLFRKTFLAILLALAASAGHAIEPKDVSVPWKGGWLKEFKDGVPAGELQGKLFLPASAGKIPFVIFLHGCGGLNLKNVTHWADFFNERGVGVLMVDSFTTRDVTEGCDDANNRWPVRRADDAAAGLAWLQAQPFVRTDRIMLMGQSQGGGVLLLAMHQRAASSQGFIAGVAMYPACGYGVTYKTQYTKPVYVLIGDEDNWTTAARCEELKALQADPSIFELTIYPGAAHNFDNPVPQGLALRKYKVGEHPASRDKAKQRVGQLIDELLR